MYGTNSQQMNTSTVLPITRLNGSLQLNGKLYKNHFMDRPLFHYSKLYWLSCKDQKPNFKCGPPPPTRLLPFA